MNICHLLTEFVRKKGGNLPSVEIRLSIWHTITTRSERGKSNWKNLFKIFENLISARPCMKVRDSLNKDSSPISSILTLKTWGNVCLRIVPKSTIFRPYWTPSVPQPPGWQNLCVQQYHSGLLGLVLKICWFFKIV